MLIQKSIKPEEFDEFAGEEFESFVNSEEYQTFVFKQQRTKEFESFVNSEEYQTSVYLKKLTELFESFVNSEEYQTIFPIGTSR